MGVDTDNERIFREEKLDPDYERMLRDGELDTDYERILREEKKIENHNLNSANNNLLANILIFYTTIGIFYLGYFHTITSQKNILAMGMAVLGFGSSVVIFFTYLIVRINFTIAVNKIKEIDYVLYDSKNDVDAKAFFKKLKNDRIIFFNEKFENFGNNLCRRGWNILKTLKKKYKMTRVSVALMQLRFQYIIIIIWSVMVGHAFLKICGDCEHSLYLNIFAVFIVIILNVIIIRFLISWAKFKINEFPNKPQKVTNWDKQRFPNKPQKVTNLDKQRFPNKPQKVTNLDKQRFPNKPQKVTNLDKQMKTR